MQHKPTTVTIIALINKIIVNNYILKLNFVKDKWKFSIIGASKEEYSY